MRAALFSTIVSLLLVPALHAGWGGVSAVATSAGAPASNGAAAGGRGGAAPVNAAANRGIATAPAAGAGYRGPTMVGGARYTPITAGARPVGAVVAPQPVGSRYPPASSRPTAMVSGGILPANRGVSPVTTARGVPQNRPNPVVAVPASRLRPRPQPYYFNHPGYYGRIWPRAGHYVPGESYVQNTNGINSGYYPYYGFPTCYLGGAFPYFYGDSGGGQVPYVEPGAVASLATPEAAPPDAATPGAGGGPAPAPAAIPPGAAGGSPVRPGAALDGPNSLVEAVQAELLRRGYFSGHPDGYFRADTGDALRRFQENHGLARTGLINEATLFALGLN